MRIASLIASLVVALVWSLPAPAQQAPSCVKSKHGPNDEIGNLNYITPEKTLAATKLVTRGKAYRLGGMVKPGTLRWDPRSLDLSFTLSDGLAAVPVRHHGAPPDLFGEGRGAVVEGTWTPDGYFKAGLIMAKHSEEYKAPHDVKEAQDPRLIKTLEGSKQ